MAMNSPSLFRRNPDATDRWDKADRAIGDNRLSRKFKVQSSKLQAQKKLQFQNFKFLRMLLLSLVGSWSLVILLNFELRSTACANE